MPGKKKKSRNPSKGRSLRDVVSGSFKLRKSRTHDRQHQATSQVQAKPGIQKSIAGSPPPHSEYGIYFNRSMNTPARPNEGGGPAVKPAQNNSSSGAAAPGGAVPSSAAVSSAAPTTSGTTTQVKRHEKGERRGTKKRPPIGEHQKSDGSANGGRGKSPHNRSASRARRKPSAGGAGAKRSPSGTSKSLTRHAGGSTAAAKSGTLKSNKSAKTGTLKSTQSKKQVEDGGIKARKQSHTRHKGSTHSSNKNGTMESKKSKNHRRTSGAKNNSDEKNKNEESKKKEEEDESEDEEEDGVADLPETKKNQSDTRRKPIESVVLRSEFVENLHGELFEGFRILLECTMLKQSKYLGRWNKRFVRLEKDEKTGKPILLYWISPSAAEFQRFNPRGVLDLSVCKLHRVSETEVKIVGAIDLQKVDETVFPIRNKFTQLKLKGGHDAMKSFAGTIQTYLKSGGVDGDEEKKFNAISIRKQTFLEKYELKEELGRGGFAVVYKAIDRKTGEEVAVKQLKLSGFDDKEKMERHLKGVENEIKIMSIVTKVFPDNPNLLKLRNVFHEMGEKSTYIVMDLMTGGELFDRIVEKSKYTERDAATIFHDAMRALRLLHKVGIVHRDLKPENIIFATKAEDATLKIADFGAGYIVGREEDDIHAGKRIGSPGYFAPEVYRMKYGTAGDIWSMGVILYCMLCGYPPFDGETDAELMMQVITCSFEFHKDHWGGISSEAKDLIKKMLTQNPSERPTVDEVLVHPWFSALQLKKEKVLLDGTVGRLKTINVHREADDGKLEAFKSGRQRLQEQFMRKVAGTPKSSSNVGKSSKKLVDEKEAEKESNK